MFENIVGNCLDRRCSEKRGVFSFVSLQFYRNGMFCHGPRQDIIRPEVFDSDVKVLVSGIAQNMTKTLLHLILVLFLFIFIFIFRIFRVQ